MINTDFIKKIKILLNLLFRNKLVFIKKFFKGEIKQKFTYLIQMEEIIILISMLF